MGNKNAQKQLDNTIFDLRFTSKQLTKESQRSEREEASEKFKAKKCIEKGVIDAARIHAENAIRKKSEALNYLRLSSKLDSVASRIQSASRTQQMTTQFERAIPQLNLVMKRMNLEKIGETMQQFDQVFENLDVATGYVNDSLNTANATVAPREQVDGLVRQIADEHNLGIEEEFGMAGTGAIAQPQAQTDPNDLRSRFENLK